MDFADLTPRAMLIIGGISGIPTAIFALLLGIVSYTVVSRFFRTEIDPVKVTPPWGMSEEAIKRGKWRNQTVFEPAQGMEGLDKVPKLLFTLVKIYLCTIGYVIGLSRWIATDHATFWQGFKELIWALIPFLNLTYAGTWITKALQIQLIIASSLIRQL
ncbi:hypothetical protein H9Q09_00675 [Aurantimonas sp. DM33-3]|uniref:hypothetical protein n=1 Tax=Aurantimonas sp. DM33-3 TaxID=2766955 RepID=UPI001651B314|nr:hypothetical protein [Aurantimonas sp. DM33-3]MBC6714699.1 hypothetical protein [Aurantimonas sp. DM33-3]